MKYDLREILSQTKSPFLTTRDFAELDTVKPQTVIKSYCEKGHYRGVVPLKQSNRRLLWKKADVEELLTRGAA